MRKDDGAPVRIEYPLADDASRAVVAQKAAMSRNSVRALFWNEEKYFAAFSELKPTRAIAAHCDRRVVGVLLIKKDGDDPFVVSRRRFADIWGRWKGSCLWYVFVVWQFVQDPPGTYCCAVWVHPHWRAEGIGGRLYQRLIDETDDEVYAMARKDAVAFHRRAGFTAHRSLYRRLIGALAGATPMFVPKRPARDAIARDS